MEPAKIEKLAKILEQIDNDYITEPQLDEALSSMTSIVKGIINDLESKLSSNSEDNLSQVNSLSRKIQEFTNKVELLSKKHDKTSSDWNSQLSREISALRGLIDNISLEKGEKGDPFTFDDLTSEQKEELKGEQGSPDTAEQVRNKLETLKGDERLDVSAIKGIGKRLAKLSESILNRAIEILDQRTQYLINKVSNVQSLIEGLQTQVSLLFTLVGGYAWMPPETPSGLIDSSNLTYQLSYIPVTYSGTLFVNGQYYDEGTDWTISDGIITMAVALDSSLSGLPFRFKGQYYEAVPITPPSADALLIQDGTEFLLQDGTDLLLN